VASIVFDKVWCGEEIFLFYQKKKSIMWLYNITYL